MTDLEELEHVAAQTAFGNGGLNRAGSRGRRAWGTHCGNGHEYTEASTRIYKQGNRIRRMCKICKKKPTYSARGYPL